LKANALTWLESRAATLNERNAGQAERRTAPARSTNLDILRCTAVLIVVVSHLFFGNYTIAVLGRLGVLFFFVHTCLVLMFSLERQHARDGSGRLFTTFMIRRIFRIYPLGIVAVLLVFLFSIPSFIVGTGVALLMPMDGLGMLSNLLLIQDVVVSEGAPRPQIGPLWTLPIELRMYLFLPLLYMLARFLPPVRLAMTLWILSVPVTVGSGGAIARVFGNPMAQFDWGWIAFPRLLEFLPVFLAGFVAYTLWNSSQRLLAPAVLPLALIAAIGGYVVILETIGRGHLLNLVGFAACLAIALILPMMREPSSNLVRTGSHLVARYSYGIYLVHASCIWFGFDKLGDHPPAIQWLAFLGTLVASTVVLYHLVERPMIQLGARLAHRWSATTRAQVSTLEEQAPVRSVGAP
jgi:peptidoglycan/LPS O-acetylase OafA/YrhL